MGARTGRGKIEARLREARENSHVAAECLLELTRPEDDDNDAAAIRRHVGAYLVIEGLIYIKAIAKALGGNG